MIIYLELIAFFSFFPRFSRQSSSWFNELEVGLYSRSYFAVLGSRREENGLRRRQLQLKFVGFDVMVHHIAFSVAFTVVFWLHITRLHARPTQENQFGKISSYLVGGCSIHEVSDMSRQ